jgi:lipoyl-dependent peroxiredoxin
MGDETIHYACAVTATGDGRSGQALSSDGQLAVQLARPVTLGARDPGPGTNPEQLFGAAYAACFHSALRSTCRRARVPVADTAVTADVQLITDAEGHVHLAVTLTGHLPGVASAAALDLMQEAHERCPYSSAVRGNVNVHLRTE